MIKLELPYVTVLVDDRFRNRLARAGERLRVAVCAYLRNAADEADGFGPQGQRRLPERRHARRHRDDGREQPHRPGVRSGRTDTQGRLR